MEMGEDTQLWISDIVVASTTAGGERMNTAISENLLEAKQRVWTI